MIVRLATHADRLPKSSQRRSCLLAEPKDTAKSLDEAISVQPLVNSRGAGLAYDFFRFLRRPHKDLGCYTQCRYRSESRTARDILPRTNGWPSYQILSCGSGTDTAATYHAEIGNVGFQKQHQIPIAGCPDFRVSDFLANLSFRNAATAKIWFRTTEMRLKQGPL